MKPSSSLYNLSHPDFVNTGVKFYIQIDRRLTPLNTHHLGLTNECPNHGN